MKISILVKIHENLEFGQISRKILILVNIFGKSQIWKDFDLGQNLEKSRN